MDIEKRYQGLESPAKMKLAVAGCPRNCSEAMVKDIGVVAVGGRPLGDLRRRRGRGVGAQGRRAGHRATAEPRRCGCAARSCSTTGRTARWLERTYDFVPRVGLEELRALLVDDRDGIVAGLDERMQPSVDSYADPWQEGREPKTSGQFADALPLIPLPQVPIRPADPEELSA